jgi:hypothetical protein
MGGKVPFFFGSARQLSVGGVLNCCQIDQARLAYLGGIPVADLEDTFLGPDPAVAEADVGRLVASDDIRPALLEHECEFCGQLG